MDKSKNNRKNYGTAYFATAFLAAFFFEFYWIMTDPYNHYMLLGTGLIMIIMGYLTMDSLLKTKAENDAIKNEQNEMMLKAQKAIYIATKKSSKEVAKVQVQNIKAMELMMNQMISSQQALLEEKNANSDDITALIDKLQESNVKLAKEVQTAITVNQLVKANADLVKNVKDALNANTMTFEQTTDLGAYVNAAIGAPATPTSPIEPTANIPVPVAEPTITSNVDEPSLPNQTVSEYNAANDINLNEFFSDDFMNKAVNETAVSINDVISDDSSNEADEITAELNMAMDEFASAVTPNETNIDISAESSDYTDESVFNNATDVVDTEDVADETVAPSTEDFIIEEALNETNIDIAFSFDEPDLDLNDTDTDIVAEPTPSMSEVDFDEAYKETNDDVAAEITPSIVEVDFDFDEAYKETNTDVAAEITPSTDEVISDGIDDAVMDELISDVSINFEDDTMNAIENEINMAEMERSEAIEELTIPDEMTTELDMAMTYGNPEEIMDDVTIEDSEDEDEFDHDEAITTGKVNSLPPDLASGNIPNRQLSDEEIAALFASL